MPAKIDVTGQRFSRLVVICKAESSKPGQHWLCQCDCGNTCIRRTGSLRDDPRKVKSCGCGKLDSIRKAAKASQLVLTKWTGPHKKQLVWLLKNMKKRCYNPGDTHYKWYGGKGVKICNEWLDDSAVFYDWCLANDYKQGLSIERKDCAGMYSPENCAFIPMAQQQANTTRSRHITREGETHHVSEWNRILGMPLNALEKRLLRGWSIERAFTQPIRQHKERRC